MKIHAPWISYTGPLLAILYFLGTWEGHEVFVWSKGLPPTIWLASGVAFSGFVVCGLHMWPWIALAAVISNLTRPFPNASVMMTIGHVLGPWISAFLFMRLTSARPALTTVREVMWFIGIGICAGSIIGSGFEVFGLYFSHYIQGETVIGRWRDWWLDEALGCLMVGGIPMVLANDHRYRNWRQLKWSQFNWEWQTLLVFAVALLIGIICYTPLGSFNKSLMVRPYLLFPVIMWASLRYGILSAFVIIWIVGGCITVGIICHSMPTLISTLIEDQLLFQQCVMLVVGMTGLVVAAVLREKEEALLARDRFLSMASHELKTPVTALKLQTQLRRHQIKRGDFSSFTPEAVNNQQASEERQLDRLCFLVDDMLDISRLRAGKFVRQCDPVELRGLVGETLQRLSSQLDEAGCAIEFEGIAGSPILGNWDSFRIEQIISNFIMNASKYGQGKPISVKVEGVGTGIARISVKDQGIGIAEADQARIFEQFERAVSETHISGLGLGLYISREIAKAHGGSIGVKSQLGLGSTFYCELPIGPDTAPNKIDGAE